MKLFALLIFLFVTGGYGQIYEYKDCKGRVAYSDHALNSNSLASVMINKLPELNTFQNSSPAINNSKSTPLALETSK